MNFALDGAGGGRLGALRLLGVVTQLVAVGVMLVLFRRRRWI